MLLYHAVEVFPVMALSDEALLELGGTKVKSDLLCMHQLLTHLTSWAQSIHLSFSMATLLTVAIALFLNARVSPASKKLYLGHGICPLHLFTVLHDCFQLQ